MELIPVIDLLNGVVVHAVAGVRKNYRPNRSCLVAGSDPVDTAKAIRDQFGINALYLADLTALQGGMTDYPNIEKLIATGLKLTADVGLNSADQVRRLFDLGVYEVVIALESLSNLTEASEFIQSLESRRFRFSVDLHGGQLLGAAARNSSPAEIISNVICLGIDQFIVLDLKSVGAGSGVSTMEICRLIQTQERQTSTWTGGGVRNRLDLMKLQQAGIDGALVATSIHDGSITPDDWSELRSGM